MSAEAGLDQRAVEICLTEIERCQRLKLKPNFIVLLGDRYGWQPLPSQIEAAEFKAIAGKVSVADKALLVWDDQQPMASKGWYSRDDNSVPPGYVLRPREETIKSEADDAAWGATETRLRGILLAAIAQLGWRANDLPMAKYIASATEQEVIQGLEPKGAEEHVFAFFRSIANLPTDARATDLVDLVAGKPNQEASSRLRALKQNLTDKLGGSHVFEYAANWGGRAASTDLPDELAEREAPPISTDHIGSLPRDYAECEKLLTGDGPHTLCVDVWRSVGNMILSQLAELQATATTADDAEENAHLEFGTNRCADFVGREKQLKEIARYVAAADPQLMVVVGEGGSGKSALMAQAYRRSADKRGEVRIERFVGATPDASEGRALLGSLCRQITHAYGGDSSAIPSEYNDLAVEFGRQLEKATSARPLVVFVDAVDQLGGDDPARSLSWLPANLPANVRLVVSTLTHTDCEGTLRNKHPEPLVLSLDKMSRKDGETALGIWLRKAGRTLQPGQKKLLLDQFEPKGRPLHLKLAFEEARIWPSFADPKSIELESDIAGLIRANLFARLAAPENHGPILVSHVARLPGR